MLSDAEGVAAIELNISCPNIKEGGIQFGCSLVGTGAVIAAVRKVTHLPVIPKLTPNVTDVASFARAAEDAGADAVSLVNTFLAMAIDVETRRPDHLQRARRPQRTGDSADRGAHGVGVRPRSEDSDHRHGRHHRRRDAVEFILAGATAVQIGTANFVDPFVWTKVLDRARRLHASATSVERLADLIGAFDPTPPKAVHA